MRHWKAGLEPRSLDGCLWLFISSQLALPVWPCEQPGPWPLTGVARPAIPTAAPALGLRMAGLLLFQVTHYHHPFPTTDEAPSQSCSAVRHKEWRWEPKAWDQTTPPSNPSSALHSLGPLLNLGLLICKIEAIIHSLESLFLSQMCSRAYYVPRTVVGIGDTSVDKTAFPLREFAS